MNSISQSGWKPEMGNAGDTAPATYTGNKALMLEEALIFDIGTAGTTGVDLADASRQSGTAPRHWPAWPVGA
jgi:glycine dehydrogenase subunit 2